MHSLQQTQEHLRKGHRDPFAPCMVPTPFSPTSWGYLAALGRMNLFDLGSLPSLLLVLGLHGWLWSPFRGHKIPNRLGLLLASLQLPQPILGCPCGESRQLSLYSGLVLLSQNACLGLGTPVVHTYCLGE